MRNMAEPSLTVENVDNQSQTNQNATTTEFVAVKKPSFCKRAVKRAFDVCSSGAVIVVLLPFFILFTPLVALAMKGNPFFVQERPGKDGIPFKLVKYRTMTNAKDKDGNLLSDAERLTKFGQLMRATSVDELPELFSIFFGKMSVVGPRPLLMKYLPLYNDFQRQRMMVRPGLTGLAQISGRNAMSWQQKFEKDVEYIQKLNLIYDLKIIFKTIAKVFEREGISQENNATMEEFKGNAPDDKQILENSTNA